MKDESSRITSLCTGEVCSELTEQVMAEIRLIVIHGLSAHPGYQSVMAAVFQISEVHRDIDQKHSRIENPKEFPN
jgi:hypothetical protein